MLVTAILLKAASAGGVFNSLLAPLAVVLGLLLALATTAGVWAAMRVGRNTQTLSDYEAAANSSASLAKSLRAELDELKERYEAALEDSRHREGEYEKEIAGLKARVAILQDLATGQTAIENLTRQAEENAAAIRETKAGIQEILTYVRARQEAR